MQISSRFTIAVHIFACIKTFENDYKITSDFLAGSTNVNPVIIRKILGQLKGADLIEVARGTGGAKITRLILHWLIPLDLFLRVLKSTSLAKNTFSIR